MCLSPLSIVNPAKSISIQGGQPLLMSVKCGKCAECRQTKRNEYSFRTYYHTKDCIDNGGYVYFVTLTYDDKHLPHISDFIDCKYKEYNIPDHSCFNREHYKLFFKRLRRRIQSKFRITDAITYFLSTEYGDDDRYTHRPHYHLLIYVKYKKIHPLWLSRIISQCWQYGRTDGINFKPLKYVAKHVYGYDLGFGDNSQTYVLRAVTHYVSKYINKNIKFQKELDKRLSKLELALSTTDNPAEVIKPLRNAISMFHMQSQGYGLAYLKNLDEKQKEYLKYDKCLLPDKTFVEKELSLPMYYMRKLYYTVKTRPDKSRFWQLTPEGITHKMSTLFNRIKETITNYEDLLSSLTSEKKQFIHLLLDNRSLYDLALYQIFYRGRLRSFKALNYYTHIADLELHETEELDTTWTDIIKQSYLSDNLDDTSLFRSSENNDLYITNYISHPYIDEEYPYFKMDKKEFAKKYCFNQTSSPRFTNFDILLDYIEKQVQEQKKNKQSTYDFKNEVSEKLKAITNVKYN